MTDTPTATGWVTTSANAGEERVRQARDIARICGLAVAPRLALAGRPAVVLEPAGARLVTDEEYVTRSHPGIGLVRLRRVVRREETDPLIDLAAIRPGDRVLDATFGFGQDALLFAQAVGPEGRVLGLEANALLAALAMGGLAYWPDPADRFVDRIELRHTDHRRFLAEAQPGDFDVIYFDPMFRRPREAAPDFATLRRYAEMSPLDPATLEQARRVATRCVIVKDAFPGRELQRLGLSPVGSRRRAEVVFGLAPAVR